MSCDKYVKAWGLVSRASSRGGKKEYPFFAGSKDKILQQISICHWDSALEQSHFKVIFGWMGLWVSPDASLLIQSLAHRHSSIISKAEMRNWRPEGVILRLCFLTCLLPVNIATWMMRVTAELIQGCNSICLCGTESLETKSSAYKFYL